MNYRIGTRGSKLALVQTEYVKKCLEERYPKDSFEVVVIRTKGDAVQNRQLNQIGGKGLFVTEIEEGLLGHTIDLAVHSMKDMPGDMTEGLIFAKAWKREDPRDVLILRECSCLNELPRGARIGTGSLRRSMQLLKKRPDLQIEAIRGNIDTRVRKMHEQKLDGIVLAAAGMHRVGRGGEISQYLEWQDMIPAATQGTLAIQLREDDTELLEKINALSDEQTELCTKAERSFLAEVGADCHMPVGGYCRQQTDGSFVMHAVYGAGADAPLFYAEVCGENPEEVGVRAAKDLLTQQAAYVLQKDEPVLSLENEPAAECAGMGTVYLLGAGPGDPKLITVRGKELLQQADCIVYDRLAAPELLDLAKPGTEMIYVGKASANHTMVQEEINATLAQKAREHACVVRLKGGDPYVFGRGGEEAIYLQERGIRFEEIPGISSALAGLAFAGIPITHRGVATGFHVITAHDKRNQMTDIDFTRLLEPKDTCVFLMGLSKVRQIAEGFIAAGRDPFTPAAVISQATTPRQKTVTGTLLDIADIVEAAQLPSPALIVVGDVIRLRKQLNFFENRPLFGHSYLVPKIGDKQSRLAEGLKRYGAQVEEVTTGSIEMMKDAFSPKMLTQIDWIIFTSKNGVQGFFGLLEETQTDIRRLSHIRFAVVGDKTAEALREYHILADMIPANATGRELAALMEEQLPAGSRIYSFTAEKTTGDMDAMLARWADYHKVMLYRNVEPECIPTMEWEKYEAVFFTSASSVKRLLQEENRKSLQKRAGESGEDAFRIYAIGSTCAKALKELGIDNVIVPQETSYKALIDTEVNKWQNMPILL